MGGLTAHRAFDNTSQKNSFMVRTIILCRHDALPELKAGLPSSGSRGRSQSAEYHLSFNGFNIRRVKCVLQVVAAEKLERKKEDQPVCGELLILPEDSVEAQTCESVWDD
jgi:hypothetical protein